MGETVLDQGTAAGDGLGRRPPIDHPPARPPQIGDYAERRASFTWAEARGWLDGLPDGRLNIAHEAVDRHARGPLADVVALRFLSRTSPTTELTYAALARETDTVAVALGLMGITRGDRVCTLLPRSPALYLTVLGALKAGGSTARCSPRSAWTRSASASSSAASRARHRHESYTRKVAPVREQLPALEHRLRHRPAEGPPAGTVAWYTTMAEAGAALDRDGFTIADTGPDDPALLHFTSGTTGRPKGAVHVHEAVVAHHATTRFSLDLLPRRPLLVHRRPRMGDGHVIRHHRRRSRCGATVVTDSADFDAKRWYTILQDERISVFYTAPTALRMLMRKGAELAHGYDLTALRHIVSVGEPLNPEAVVWGLEAFGLPVHDTWWQTETGAIMVSNFPGMPVRPGSMGRPMPGVETGILERGADGRAAVVDGHVRVLGNPSGVGELALRPGWPSMFRDYLGEPERYARAFADGWYLTGDLAQSDADGYLWFVGRADDVIKSAGHLIGPFEVESALMEHPAVAEVGVIGKPDPLAGEIVKAFVTLKADHSPSDALRRELIMFGRRRLGSVAPREVEFEEHLPHTRSGKVMRRLLKARELGLPEGDLSTVEKPS